MFNKDDIKRYIGKLQNDVLFEKIVGHLSNDNDVIFEPKGIFNKGILNDIEKVSSKKKHLFIEVNRPGIYDILPKGLFHNKVDDINNQGIFFEQVENIKKVARRFFLPFDSEIISGFSEIERVSLNHYKNSYDSNILISLLNFFHIQDEIDFLSFLEILAIDIVSYSRRYDINDDIIYRKLNNILHQNISPYNLIKNLLELTKGNSKIIRLMNVIPFAPSSAGKLSEIEELLQYLINQKNQVKRIKELKYYNVPDGQSKNHLNTSLNTDTNSMIVGRGYCDEIGIVNILVEIDQENMFLMNSFINGAIHKLLHTFLSFFLDFQDEFRISFHIKGEPGQYRQSHFMLETVPNEQIEKMQNLRLKLLGYFKNQDFHHQSFRSSIPVNTTLLLKDYFISFTKLISAKKIKYPYLNMNTKI